MKNQNQSHWILKKIAEENVPQTTINLWSKIENQVISGSYGKDNRFMLGSMKMRTALALLVTVFILGSLVFVPAVRAFAEEVIQRLGIAYLNTERLDSHAQVIGIEATKNFSPPHSLTIQQAEEQINFVMMLPTWLPEKLTFTSIGISEYDLQGWEGSGKKLSITYSASDSFDPAGGIVNLYANDGPINAPPLLAETSQQLVNVNGQPGYYVHGGWQDNGMGDPEIRLGNLLWDDQTDDAYLTWEQNGVTYLLEVHNLGLELDDLLRIAESFKAW